MLMRNSAKPLYIQIKEDLETAIKSNKYPKDTKLPSEKELCEKYQVSRITIRKAIELLDNMGMIYAVQGKGSYVKTPMINAGLTKICTFGEMLAKNGCTGFTKILSYEEKAVDSMERLWKGPEWSNTSLLDLVGYSMNEPVVLYRSMINSLYGAQMYQEALKKEKNGEAFSTFDLYTSIGLHVGNVNQQILAISADKETAELLKLQPGKPVLVLESVIMDDKMRSVEYKKGYYRTDKYAFTLHREI